MYTRDFLSFSILFAVTSVAAALQLPLRDGEEFDFIVVGGGTGGCVVAGRLAESGEHSVLLIHEGGLPHPDLEIPAFSSFNAVSQNYQNDLKSYRSIPQRNAALRNNGTIQYTIGKSIGGGSSVNGMVWNRGNPKDYNNWAKSTNDDSWSYENLLKYFRKTENYAGSNPTDQRGYNGPIPITNPPNAPAIIEHLQAGQEIGYPIGDPNGPQTPSISLIDFSRTRGRRVSSFYGYVRPLLKNGTWEEQERNNLFVLLNTEAKRIIFEGNKAVGVTYIMNNSSKTGYARARKEIIISAGVMDSPAILMRSGIGPEDVLKKANIPIVKTLPVGKNLKDHVSLLLPIIYGNRSVAVIPSRDFTPENWRLYQEKGTGPYSSYMGRPVQGFFLSNLEDRRLDNWPDLHLFPSLREVNATEAVVQDLKKWEVLVYFFQLLVRARSVGTVTLNPDNVDGQPLVDFQYFSHPDDIKAMLDFVKISEKMCERTVALQSLGCRLSSTPLSACSHFNFRSEAYWECYIKQRTIPGLHAGGTCRMGSGPEDPEAVVDSRLKVIGIDGLRVADASIAPIVSNANTQAMVYVIAEKAADMILNEWEEGSTTFYA